MNATVNATTCCVTRDSWRWWLDNVAKRPPSSSSAAKFDLILHRLVPFAAHGEPCNKDIINITMLVQCSLAVIVLAQAAAATLVADRAQAKRDIAAWGGYALLVKDKDCPNSTLDCGVASCCPKGTACNDEPSSGPVCCPNDSKCV